MTATEPPLGCPDDHAKIEYERAQVSNSHKIWVTHRLTCKGCDVCVRYQEIINLNNPVNPG